MGILDEAKTLVKLAQQIDNKELYAKILALQSDLIGLYEDNIGLRQQVAEFQVRLKLKSEVLHEINFYWIMKDGKKDGPFCTRCYDDDGKLIRIPEDGSVDAMCPKCRSGFSRRL